MEVRSAVRSFNRTVTQRVGALNDEFLGRDRPLGQARVLWEIGPDGADVRSLRARLELDSGYLSRLLRSLEADGLVVVEQSSADARVRTARPTAAGLAERAVLDQRADELAAAILEPLSERQRSRLAGAMAEVERLLMASMVRVEAYDPRHPHARFCIRSYFEELARRFDGGFDPALSIPAGDAELTPPAGVLLVASLRAEPVGCGALKFRAACGAKPTSLHGDAYHGDACHGDAPAEIKRMWVAPAVRGLGVGRRLLAELEARAAASGVRTLRLETNRMLAEAIALYRSAGYREVAAFNDEPYADHWFEKALGGA